jgi:hypothetical protein
MSVARSARAVATAVTGLLVLGGVTGCVSTQTKNSRTLLVNARTLDSQSALRVTRINPDVAVTSVGLIRSPRGTAIAVALHNRATRALSDLPISVGVLQGRIRRYLNRRANLPYYDTHIPSIAPGARAIWVLPVHRALPSAATPFAEVGVARQPMSTSARALPQIDAVLRPGVTGRGPHVRVTNTTGVPQYDLQVYAVGIRAGHFLAAGRASAPTLDGGAQTSLRLDLIGRARGTQLWLSAPATIFN